MSFVELFLQSPSVFLPVLYSKSQWQQWQKMMWNQSSSSKQCVPLIPPEPLPCGSWLWKSLSCLPELASSSACSTGSKALQMRVQRKGGSFWGQSPGKSLAVGVWRDGSPLSHCRQWEMFCWHSWDVVSLLMCFIFTTWIACVHKLRRKCSHCVIYIWKCSAVLGRSGRLLLLVEGFSPLASRTASLDYKDACLLFNPGSREKWEKLQNS